MLLTSATFVLMMALAAGVALPKAAAATGRPSLKVVALGDSLTSGHRLPKDDAYPALLEKKLKEQGFDATVVNRGISGDTSAGGVRRLEAALAERPDVLIVAFGANDGLRGIPVAQVRANLSKIIATAQTRGIKVLLVGMEALPLYGWQYTLDFHTMFPELAAKYRVPLVPFILNGVFGNRELMSPDGVHPNAGGAKVVAENIWTELAPLAKSLLVATE